jgi:hypothetical protein
MKELCQALRSKPGVYTTHEGQEIILGAYGYQLPIPLEIPSGASVDLKKKESLRHLLDSSHLRFKDGVFVNTGTYQGVNNTSGQYWTNVSADEVAEWANQLGIKLIG